jgi:hypothetical protein
VWRGNNKLLISRANRQSVFAPAGLSSVKFDWMKIAGLDGYLRVDYGRLGLRLMTLSEWDSLGADARP